MNTGVALAPIHLEEVNASKVIQAPFPHFCIDNILDSDFANEVHDAFPIYEEARRLGLEFSAINEKRKTQVTDAKKFPAPIFELYQLLASDAFIKRVEEMTGIPNLIADPELVGGGIHETNSGGRLDVHVDFNYIKERQLHRRVNILFYFNKDWKEEYGGYLDIWDRDVKTRHGYFSPDFNRACGFVTGQHSWHGVTPVTCPTGMFRKSFAVYYYTKEAPEGWDGLEHSTIFKARPNEWVKGNLSMPLESALRDTRAKLASIKSLIKSHIK